VVAVLGAEGSLECPHQLQGSRVLSQGEAPAGEQAARVQQIERGHAREIGVAQQQPLRQRDGLPAVFRLGVPEVGRGQQQRAAGKPAALIEVCLQAGQHR